jgi:regulatory factor X 1/2/3
MDGMQVVQPTYVQYLEKPSEPAIYTVLDGQMPYPLQVVREDGTTYTLEPSQYHSENTATPVYNQIVGDFMQETATGHLIAQENGAYHMGQNFGQDIALGPCSTQSENPQALTGDAGGVKDLLSGHKTPDASMETDGHLDTTFSFPTIITWLLQNYEAADGICLACCTVYDHYRSYCKENKVDPVNQPSFGKIVRSVFLGLKTRRLGTRGNTKYHFCGIRAICRPASNTTLEETSAAFHLKQAPEKSYNYLSSSGISESATQIRENPFLQNTNHSDSYDQSYISPREPPHHKSISKSGVTFDFPDINFPLGISLIEDCTLQDVRTFRNVYKKHCAAFLTAVMSMEFHTVEGLWREFWQSHYSKTGEEIDDQFLPKAKLYLLCKCEPVQEFVRRVDYVFYQSVVKVLIPDVLMPIPILLMQAICNFANRLELWLTGAMKDYPEEIMHIKLVAVRTLAQTLRRYTSLNHLAQATLGVLQNSSEMDRMLGDLNQVDFCSVQQQISWVCECDDSMVQQLEADFKRILHQQNSLDQFSAWMKGVVKKVLEPYEGNENFTKAAKEFLLRWSFCISVVIRDLTLRNSESFGSFHLIRLLFDEYMFYLIEHQVAQKTGTTPIAVMGENLSKIRTM